MCDFRQLTTWRRKCPKDSNIGEIRNTYICELGYGPSDTGVEEAVQNRKAGSIYTHTNKFDMKL